MSFHAPLACRAAVRPLAPTQGVLIIAACLATLSAFPAAAAGATGRDAVMLHVDPAARVEQRCNARAMGEVSRADKDMRPEEVVAYAFAEPQQAPAAITAPGAAIRSHGRWYHLAYQCRTSTDGMDVVTFSYKLGAEVPRAEWAEHSLVP
ncbi:DUF930 domain-containing protein [Xanthobacter sp. AM11]|uniref:DUF930 domain-containing protein n=1 Tax=Xanthobacter sp. AM11 TaxID=3380643 RepID=UPI0039BEEBC2